MELAERLFVAGVAIVGPTLLFIGLWRGLMRLQDGELVERVCARMDETPSSVAVGAPALGREARNHIPDHGRVRAGLEGPSPIPAVPGARRVVRCDECGSENDADYDFCGACQAGLPDG